MRSDMNSGPSLIHGFRYRLEKIEERFKAERLPVIVTMHRMFTEEDTMIKAQRFNGTRFLPVTVEPLNGLVGDNHHVLSSFSISVITDLAKPGVQVVLFVKGNKNRSF